MTYIIRFLRTLLGIFALFVFAISLVIAVICYVVIFFFFPEKTAPQIAHKYISRTWSRALFPLFGIHLRIRNQELLDPSQTYVFTANHRSQLDIPSYAVATKHTFRFLAKSELMKIPLLGYVVRKLYISVDRKDKAARARSMDNMMQSLREGVSVFICPEGTRNKTDKPLLDFHDGAFRLAINAGVPLAVMTIRNSDKRLSPHRPIELSPGTIDCIWNKPIETKGMTESDIPMLREMTRKIMEQNLSNKN